MKKFFAFLAAALLVVACGGTKEKSNAIEDQLLDHVAKIEKAVEAGDVKASVEAMNAWEKWESSLDKQQYAEYETFVDKHLDRISDMITAYNYLPLGEYSFEQSLADECCDECCDEEYDEWADEDDDDEDYDDEDYDDEDYDDEDYDDEDYDDEW